MNYNFTHTSTHPNTLKWHSFDVVCPCLRQSKYIQLQRKASDLIRQNSNTKIFSKIILVFILNFIVVGKNIHRWVAPTLIELKRREDKLGGKKSFPRNTFLEWNLEAELYAFGKRLNEDLDSDLLLQAFTDRSYVIKEEMKQKEMEFDLKMNDNRELAEGG